MLRVQLYIFDTLEKLFILYKKCINLSHKLPIGCLHVERVIQITLK